MLYKGNYQILNTLVTACDYSFLLKEIEQNIITKKEQLLICPIASQTIVRASKDKKLNKVIRSFNYVVPCSEWVKRSINFIYGNKLNHRVYGPNLMLKVCKLSQSKGYKVFLYGASQKTVLLLKNELESKYPGINIVGALPSKFSPLTKREKKELISEINKNHADILLVGLGSPLQEFFIYDLLNSSPTLNKGIIAIPVGASFDFISRSKPQAPVLLQNVGLEWFFRLLTEPRRLWRRYIILGPLFILMVLHQKLKSFDTANNVAVEKKIWS